MKIISKILLSLLLLLACIALFLYVQYGGGKAYPDLSTPPLLPKEALEQVLSWSEPIGNVAVASDGRVFFTVHPESRPESHKLLVWEPGKGAGTVRPFPSGEQQKSLFDTVLGLRIDGQGRLWTIDHGRHGTGKPRLLAFDINSGKQVFDLVLPSEVAPLGSFLQDLAVDARGEFVYIADVSFVRKQSGLVVVETQNRRAWRALSQHESVMPQDWVIRHPQKEMVFFGLLALKPGVDGITLSRDGKMLYFGAMTHDTLFRVPVAALATPKLARQAGSAVQAVGKKPLNDGLSSDEQGNVYLTDVEHSGVMRMAPDGKLVTLIRDEARIRWADALSFGPDGYLYVADSAIPDQMLQSRAHMQARAPYFIYRFKPGGTAVSGQ
jgi:sugar lactone lactonase YvrE